ncbi:MAG: hypothetical protein ACFBSC_15800 [Microcoleaceae cyanobacterium]
MAKFEDLDLPHQSMVASSTVALQYVRRFFSTQPRLVQTVLSTAAGNTKSMTPKQLKALMQQLDEYIASSEPKMFSEFQIDLEQFKIRKRKSTIERNDPDSES